MIKKLQSRFQKAVKEANEASEIEKKVKSTFGADATDVNKLAGKVAMDMASRSRQAKDRAIEELGTNPAKVKKPTSLKSKLKK